MELEKEVAALAALGISLRATEEALTLELGTVGKEVLLILVGEVTVGNDRRRVTCRAGDVVSRQFFGGSPCSAMMLPHSHCVLLTQELLDHLTGAQPRVAAKLFRRVATAFIHTTLDSHAERSVGVHDSRTAPLLNEEAA